MNCRALAPGARLILPDEYPEDRVSLPFSPYVQAMLPPAQTPLPRVL